MLPLVPCKRSIESSEEDSDEVWEQVDAPIDAPIVNQQDNPSTHQVNNLTIGNQTIILKGKKSGISKKDRMLRSLLHQIHLICLLAAASIRNQWCNDVEIQAICLSMITKSVSKNRLFKHSLRIFLNYWRGIISTNGDDVAHLDSLEEIRKGLKGKAMYSRNSFNIVFAAACRSMQLNVRLLACLSPISLSFAAGNNTPFPIQIWIEVWDEFHSNWVSIDAAKDIIDEPFKIIDSSQTRKSWGDYVLAFDSTFGIKDVTQKYTDEWGSKVSKYRLRGDLEAQWLLLLSKFSRSWHDERDQAEDESIRKNVIQEKMPTNLKGFLNHPLYALEKQTKRNEVIYPAGLESAIGRFKNDLVYPRSSVQRAFTIEGWVRQGRSVKDGEEPCKTLTQKSGKAKSETENNLYGEWQTKPYEPPSLDIHGKIPKNSFGNIEIFHPLMVPKGAVHILGYPEALKVAKQLELDFALAVTGFEFYRGKTVPKIEGIVINQENRDLLLSAIVEYTKKSLEKESKKRESRVLKSWLKLTRGILSLNHLREQYLR